MSIIAPLPPISIGAFPEKAETYAALQNLADDPRMTRTQMRVEWGGLESAQQVLVSAPSPDLLLIESHDARDVLFQKLDALADLCDPNCKLIIIGGVNDVQLYRELMDRGVSDYLVEPFQSADLLRLIAGLYVRRDERLVGRVIAVVGAKGGVGASTLAHNLAVSMARELDQRVILVDMDLPFGTAALNLNHDPTASLLDVIAGGSRVDANFVERLLIPCEKNLNLLAAPAKVEHMPDLVLDVFDGMMDALRTSAPFIILDLPHGWPAWKERLILSADNLVLVAEPDLANLRNAKNILDTLRIHRPHDLSLHLLLNHMSVPKRQELTLNDLRKALNVTPAAMIVHDASLFSAAANQGKYAIDQAAGVRLKEILRQLAFSLSGRAEVPASRFSLISLFLARLRSAFG